MSVIVWLYLTSQEIKLVADFIVDDSICLQQNLFPPKSSIWDPHGINYITNTRIFKFAME